MLCTLIVILSCALPISAWGVNLSVFVSIAPQAYFVERIGGDRVDVHVLVQPGHSPATYEPTPRQMSKLATARLFFRIGVPFENAFLPKIQGSLDSLLVVDTRAGVPLRIMQSVSSEDGPPRGEHIHPGNGTDVNHVSHAHEGADPHIWLSPSLVKIQAHTIAGALIKLDRGGQEFYEQNLAAFIHELDSLDTTLKEILGPIRGKSLLVFHPSWGYFADSYGLNQVPIEVEGKRPSGRQLARIIGLAETEDIRVIFVQPQFSASSAEAIANAIGGKVVAIDPLSGNYVDNLLNVAKTIRAMLEMQG